MHENQLIAQQKTALRAHDGQRTCLARPPRQNEKAAGAQVAWPVA
jgi:hypothetical protein